MPSQGLLPSSDADQLRVLSTFHYVLAGMAALFACIPILHLVIGIVALTVGLGTQPQDQTDSLVIGLAFTILSLLFMVPGWTMAAFVFAAGRCLAQRKRHRFCLIMGGIECLFMPFGTILGVFTILALSRPTTKVLFTEVPTGQFTTGHKKVDLDNVQM